MFCLTQLILPEYTVLLFFCRSLFRYVFNDVEQCLTTALFTARADGS